MQAYRRHVKKGFEAGGRCLHLGIGRARLQAVGVGRRGHGGHIKERRNHQTVKQREALVDQAATDFKGEEELLSTRGRRHERARRPAWAARFGTRAAASMDSCVGGLRLRLAYSVLGGRFSNWHLDCGQWFRQTQPSVTPTSAVHAGTLHGGSSWPANDSRGMICAARPRSAAFCSAVGCWCINPAHERSA